MRLCFLLYSHYQATYIQLMGSFCS